MDFALPRPAVEFTVFAHPFWSLVHIRSPDECWGWKGWRRKDGYGMFERRRAHRVAYELVKGPVPAGREVGHTCDNPPCCNPAHLDAVTHRENLAAMASKGRARSGTAKLSEEQVLAIRSRAERGEPQVQLAQEFGVSEGCLSNVVNRRTYSRARVRL